MVKRALPGRITSSHWVYIWNRLISNQPPPLSPHARCHIDESRAFYDETWVALNWKVVLPTPTTHPDFPLWKLGFTPQQVYDLFFPTNFRFICNPERPAVCGRFGLPEDRLCRFEFVVRRDEDGDEMAGPVKIKEVVFPYFSHAGSHYG